MTQHPCPNEAVMKRPNCPICDTPLSFQWTDRHGIGACTTCNAPVQIYHYETEGSTSKLVELPPTFIVREDWIPILKRYWGETKMRAPNGCNIPGSSYEPCGYEEFSRWNKWLEEHADELPKEEADGEEK